MRNAYLGRHFTLIASKPRFVGDIFFCHCYYSCICPFCKIKYKANLNDYKMFSMYLLNNKERKTILTSGKNLILTNKLNDYSKLHIFENKNEFNEVFGDYLKRKWMFINRKNYNEFECFIKNMDYIIAKPNDNTEGKRIEKKGRLFLSLPL